MRVVFEQILLLLVFIGLGYILSKTGKANGNYSKLLSQLGFYIFLPSNVFRTFANNFNTEYLSANYPLIIVSAVYVVAMMFIGIPISKLLSKDAYQQAIYRYSLISSNYGYVGYALAGSIFGDQVLLNVMMFTIPLSVYTYSIGYCMLTKNKLSFKKLLSPVNIALVAGAIVGITGFRLPGIVSTFLSKSIGCMGPISMLLTGMVIAQYDIKALLGNKSVYILAVLRLLVIPIGVCGLMVLLGLRELLLPVLVILSLPCGLNTIVFPKLIGEDCKTGAALACVTSVLCCATIPLCLRIFGVY